MNFYPTLKYILTAVTLGFLSTLAIIYVSQLSAQEPNNPNEGVHILMDVDMEFAIDKSLNIYEQELRSFLNKKKIKYIILTHISNHLIIHFKTIEYRDLAHKTLKQAYKDQFEFIDGKTSKSAFIKINLTKKNMSNTRQQTLDKNITILRNRVKAAGITKSIIKKQGQNQIVIQFPEIQDLTQAKKSLGRSKTTLEFRLVDEYADPFKAQKTGRIPSGSKLYLERNGNPILLKRRVILSSEYMALTSAKFDNNQQPSIIITLDKKGAKLFSKVTRANIQKLMAIVLINYKADSKKLKDGSFKKIMTTTSQVINVARIQDELSKRFQLTGLESLEEAQNLALSINTGALAAPVYIVEEHIISGKAK